MTDLGLPVWGDWPHPDSVTSKFKMDQINAAIINNPALELAKTYIISEITDERQETFSNGLRRAVQLRRPTGASRYTGPVELWVGQSELTGDDAGVGLDPEVQEENTDSKRFNSTAAGQSLLFLSRLALHNPGHSRELLPIIKKFGESLLGYQNSDPNTLRRGGFILAPNYTITSAFGTATVGKGMLYAYKATNNDRFFASAINAADYLMRLADPNPHWNAAYGISPINRESGGVTWHGFCDRVDNGDKISTTCTTWNLIAAAFLYELGNYMGPVLGASYIATALQARDFMATGALEARDYFAVSSNVGDGSKVTVAWPNVTSHVYNDHAWHRLGDLANTGSVGTDNPEYGLKSLLALGYDDGLIAEVYTTLRDLPHSGALGIAAENSDGGAFGLAWQKAVTWCGYLRLDTFAINGRPDRQFGTYYDTQGAGTLAGLKKILFPADYAESLHVLENVIYHGALLDQNFDTKWSAASGFDWATKGTIVIASAGNGMIDALEEVA